MSRNEIQECAFRMSKSFRAKQVSLTTTTMSALIISLCVSVGQFQALEKRVKRSHEDGLTAITSAKNRTIDNNFLKFNVNTRGWQMFVNWKINVPQLRTQGFGKIAYNVVTGKRERQRLLISGASDQFPHVISKRGVFANWLYAVDTNSWQTVDNGESPPYASSPFMIKLCSKIIAFTFDQWPRRAWIFDTMSLNWQKTRVYGRLGFLFRNKVEVAAVAVVQSQTNCSCHQSAFVLLQTCDFSSLVHSVRCVDREGTEGYKLILDIKNTLLSSIKSIIASSNSSIIVLYDPAKQTLWKFENETWTNVTAVPYFLPSFYDESLSQTFGCVVSTRNSNIIVFNVCNRKVLNFDLNRNTCILEDVAGNIPDKKIKVVSGIVEHENTIIVFTNDMYSEEIRVWKFMYELKVWTCKIFPRPDAVSSLAELSTYAFKSNYVSFARQFTGVTDERSWYPYIWNLDLSSLQWWKKHVFNSIPDKICEGFKGSSWFDIFCLVAICSKENSNVIEVWIYNATDNKLRQLVLLSSINARYMTSFVSVNKAITILFGGIIPNRTANPVFGERWIMQFQPMFKCRQSSGEMVHSIARFSHATVMMQSKVYVFDGVNASGGCLNDLWVFDVNTERWSEVTANNGGPSFLYHASCEYSAASTPGLLIIVIYQRIICICIYIVMLTTARAMKVSLKCKRRLTLAICLSLAVEQVQSFNMENEESITSGLKLTRSAENIHTKNETEFAHFDVNARGWQSFNSWVINEPRVKQYGMVAYRVKIRNREQHHLLISGGRESSVFSYNHPAIFGSWLYTMHTNSWQKVDSDKFPPLSGKLLMVQLCSKVFVLGSLDTKGVKAWLFDTVSHNWQQTNVAGDIPKWLPLTNEGEFDAIKIVSVSVPPTKTTCQCHQSAIIFSYLSQNGKLTTHEVQCVNQNITESYKWINFKFSIPNYSDDYIKLASSFSGSILLYSTASISLWKCKNETWTNVLTISTKLQPFQDVSSRKTFGCALIKQTSTYLAFNIRDQKVLVCDLKRNRCVIEYVASDIPDHWYVDVLATVVEDSNKIIVFITDIFVGRISVWKFIYRKGVWLWKKWRDPSIALSSRLHSSYDVKDSDLTVVGGFSDKTFSMNQPLSNGLIWNLDLGSMQWWLKVEKNISDDRFYEASTFMKSCCFVALGYLFNQQKLETWIYNTSDNTWKLLISTSLIAFRQHMSLATANATTAVLFGGRIPSLGVKVAFDETWILTLNPKLQWRKVDRNSNQSLSPCARSTHAAVMMQSKMYVFGGMNASMKCLNDLWVFDVETEQWSEVKAVNEGPDLSGVWPCAYSAASTPGQLLLSVACDTGSILGIVRCKDVVMQTWMFIINLRTWYLVAIYQLNENSARSFGGVLSKSVYWKGFLIMFDSTKVNIKYLAVRCPAGLTSVNISEKPCNFCKKGYYRETMFSDPNCVPCPDGLTTVNVGARKVSECTVCDVDRCKYGKCVPNFKEGSLRPTCKCDVGFTGSKCQYPTYYLIGAGITLFVAVASAGVTAYLLVLHRKRLSERTLRKTVDVLTDVWQIDEDEVTSGELLGYGASGSVYKASYRNLTLAVKKMMGVGLPKSIEDFETEIMFMRTVRHKNIVLFIGAGKSQPGDVPFLVMEYMERGSLRNVLYDLSIDIDYERKVSFAMDSARGMHSLHSFEPPRIHRDLKSDNLLVSKNWIVKVADFGLGRTVNSNIRKPARQQIRRNNRSEPQNISLLPKREGLSYAGVGTARWRAPELILREPYDTAVDVYRYYDTK